MIFPDDIVIAEYRALGLSVPYDFFNSAFGTLIISMEMWCEL